MMLPTSTSRFGSTIASPESMGDYYRATVYDLS